MLATILTKTCYHSEKAVFDKPHSGEILPVPTIACKRLYEDYVEWCLENGYRPLNSCNFGKEVKRAFPNVKRVNRRNGNPQQWYYEGIYKIM